MNLRFNYCLLALLWLNQVLPAQKNVEDQIRSIRSEFQWINAHLNSFTKQEAYYTVEEAYWNNTRYFAYLNSNNQIVKFMYTIGEEGYWSNYEYYFKNGSIIFIFVHSGEPDGREEQERIYFCDKKIIQALFKKKMADDKRGINDIPNELNDNIMKNVEHETQRQLNNVQAELDKYYEALNKQ